MNQWHFKVPKGLPLHCRCRFEALTVNDPPKQPEGMGLCELASGKSETNEATRA